MVAPRLDDPLTADQLRAALRYLPATGFFVWNSNDERPKDWNTKYTGTKAGTRVARRGYIQIMVNGRLYLGHRLAWLWMTGNWPDDEVDHIDRDPSNNRWDNLRAATSSQSKINTGLRRDNQSGHKGVHWSSRRQKWCAEVWLNGKKHTYGYFASIEDAVAARELGAKQLHGQFARS